MTSMALIAFRSIFQLTELNYAHVPSLLLFGLSHAEGQQIHYKLLNFSEADLQCIPRIQRNKQTTLPTS